MRQHRVKKTTHNQDKTGLFAVTSINELCVFVIKIFLKTKLRTWNCVIVHDVFRFNYDQKLKTMTNYNLITAIFLTVLVTTLTGCSSSTTSLENIPPQLPPSVVLEGDFAMFSENNPGDNLQAVANNAENPYGHFLNASSRALLLNSALSANLFLPATLLTAAETVEPVLNEDEEWEWNFSVSGNSQTFSVSLVGDQQSSGETIWSVFVSNSLLAIDNELLLEGVSSMVNNSGTWTVNQLAGFGTVQPLLQLNWEFDSITSYSSELEFFQILEIIPIQSIRMERDNEGKRTISRDTNDAIRSDISWNTDTKEGSIISPEYNDGERACWNSMLLNTECN